MTGYLLAGGGTAGHVNPLLAVADALRERDPDDEVLVLGTREGLEARLVPARGYELAITPKLPFPRRPDARAIRFVREWRGAVREVARTIEDRGIDVVVGFGGYAAAPAYLAARRTGRPFVVHEANARPGLANRLGARLTPYVGVAFPGTPLRGAEVVGMPLRREVVALDRRVARPAALAEFDLADGIPTLLVTGGSLGARRLNTTVSAAAGDLVAAGYQVLHIAGGSSEVVDPGIPGYRLLEYCDRMDLALALADAAVSRSGAATVSELTALGIPAVYVPYPVGNGEQRLNAAEAVRRGAARLVDDAAFTPEFLRRELIPLLADRAALDRMAVAAADLGVRDGSERMVALIDRAAAGLSGEPAYR